MNQEIKNLFRFIRNKIRLGQSNFLRKNRMPLIVTLVLGLGLNILFLNATLPSAGPMAPTPTINVVDPLTGKTLAVPKSVNFIGKDPQVVNAKAAFLLEQKAFLATQVAAGADPQVILRNALNSPANPKTQNLQARFLDYSSSISRVLIDNGISFTRNPVDMTEIGLIGTSDPYVGGLKTDVIVDASSKPYSGLSKMLGKVAEQRITKLGPNAGAPVLVDLLEQYPGASFKSDSGLVRMNVGGLLRTDPNNPFFSDKLLTHELGHASSVDISYSKIRYYGEDSHGLWGDYKTRGFSQDEVPRWATDTAQERQRVELARNYFRTLADPTKTGAVYEDLALDQANGGSRLAQAALDQGQKAVDISSGKVKGSIYYLQGDGGSPDLWSSKSWAQVADQNGKIIAAVPVSNHPSNYDAYNAEISTKLKDAYENSRVNASKMEDHYVRSKLNPSDPRSVENNNRFSNMRAAHPDNTSFGAKVADAAIDGADKAIENRIDNFLTGGAPPPSEEKYIPYEPDRRILRDAKIEKGATSVNKLLDVPNKWGAVGGAAGAVAAVVSELGNFSTEFKNATTDAAREAVLNKVIVKAGNGVVIAGVVAGGLAAAGATTGFIVSSGASFAGVGAVAAGALGLAAGSVVQSTVGVVLLGYGIYELSTNAVLRDNVVAGLRAAANDVPGTFNLAVTTVKFGFEQVRDCPSCVGKNIADRITNFANSFKSNVASGQTPDDATTKAVASTVAKDSTVEPTNYGNNANNYDKNPTNPKARAEDFVAAPDRTVASPNGPTSTATNPTSAQIQAQLSTFFPTVSPATPLTLNYDRMTSDPGTASNAGGVFPYVRITKNNQTSVFLLGTDGTPALDNVGSPIRLSTDSNGVPIMSVSGNNILFKTLDGRSLIRKNTTISEAQLNSSYILLGGQGDPNKLAITDLSINQDGTIVPASLKSNNVPNGKTLGPDTQSTISNDIRNPDGATGAPSFLPPIIYGEVVN